MRPRLRGAGAEWHRAPTTGDGTRRRSIVDLRVDRSMEPVGASTMLGRRAAIVAGSNSSPRWRRYQTRRPWVPRDDRLCRRNNLDWRLIDWWPAWVPRDDRLCRRNNLDWRLIDWWPAWVSWDDCSHRRRLLNGWPAWVSWDDCSHWRRLVGSWYIGCLAA